MSKTSKMSEFERNTLLIGSGFFLAVSIVFYLAKPYARKVFHYLLVPIYWTNLLGVLLLSLGLIYFAIERWMNTPFFYGKCQSGGSNANSFFVLVLGVFTIDFTTVQFVIALIAVLVYMAVVGCLVSKLRREKKGE
ncbi:hypothetical protein [Peptacetobacter hiranonis]|uniref:hypothetical protein n=1 Tax=Peptacetobacter hiranonis TaxID=89152 RepID=UPI0022E2DFC4|nr:hypothetical protein [Peptacetobacter hiranonis]